MTVWDGGVQARTRLSPDPELHVRILLCWRRAIKIGVPGTPLASCDAVDCLEFLKNQHDEAKKLFKRLEKAEGSEAAKIWSELSEKLSMHETLEEKLFYPELKKADSTEEIVLEGYQEHHVMDLLIGEIGKLKPTDEAFSPKVKVLQENTEHHIEEEEGELFPKVRKLWNAERRSEVGEKMEAMMEQLPRHQKAA